MQSGERISERKKRKSGRRQAKETALLKRAALKPGILWLLDNRNVKKPLFALIGPPSEASKLEANAVKNARKKRKAEFSS